MVAPELEDNYLALESVEVLLRRVGGDGDGSDGSEADLFFGNAGDVDYNAVAGLVQRSKEGQARLRLLNLVSRLKQSRGNQLSLGAKGRVLQVLYSLRGAGITPRPGATLQSHRAAKRLATGPRQQTSVYTPALDKTHSTIPPDLGSSIPGAHRVLPMSTFIKQGVYVMQGVATTVIPEDGDVENAPHSACQIAAEQLREVGVLQARVKNDLGSKADRSLLHQSLQHGIRREMYRFDGAMGELMAQCDARSENQTSLPRLLLAADKVATDLGFIRWAQLAADQAWAKGKEESGAIAATLESFTRHAAAPPGLFKSLRDAAFKPLVHTVCQWIVEGVLDDPYEEFFVQKARDKDVPLTADSWWDAKYTLRTAALPPFVSMQMADDVLLTGKSIIFLRKHCGDSFHMPPSVKRLVPEGDNVNPASLGELVAAAKAAVDERVLEVVFDEHKLAEHLYAAKSLMLLSEGDFFEGCYLGRVGQMLRSESTEVLKQRYQLLPAIEECVLKTQMAKILTVDPWKYIDAGMLDGEGPASGLDRLFLTYITPQPLRTVLRGSLLDGYYKPIFSFLWRLRRLQKDLILGRGGFKQILHARCHKSMAKHTPEWWMKLHRASETASHVAHSMLQFVNALASYMFIDGLDVMWKEFEDRAKNASTFDEVILLHRETITMLHRHALLDSQYLELKQCVEAVLGVVAEYLTQAAKLQQVGQDMLLRLQDVAGVSKVGGAWMGPTSSSVLKIEETGLAVSQLRRKYVRAVGCLLQTLDRGLDPQKIAREGAGAFTHTQMSPRRIASLRPRAQPSKLSMGSLQRLRTALDFNRYFADQYDITVQQLPGQPMPMEISK
ncbi:Gamma-tubulin complex component 3 [Diplonema papillatum]|nr:Gamma-tubulin complex component 3 [Diplonema papillatum]